MISSSLKKQALALLALTVSTATLTPGVMAQQMEKKGEMAKAAMKPEMQKGEMSKTAMMKPEMKKERLGLEGYCPVCVIAMRKWEKGNPQIKSTFDGITYHFPSEAVKAKFDAKPQMYVPVLSGDCILCYEKMDKRVPGNIRHAAIHKERLFLFPSDKEKAVFMKTPSMFAKSDLGVNGECVVCLAKMGKHVPGSAKHTVFNNGLRYLFPSEAEADMFRKSPTEFVTKVEQAMKKDMQAAKEMKNNMHGKKDMQETTMRTQTSQTIKVAGRAGCAGCEFGVKPLSAPEELGLAIVGEDGNITVVENAHMKYPQIYKSRFEGKQLVAEGTVIKTKGRISWLRPDSLKVMN